MSAKTTPIVDELMGLADAYADAAAAIARRSDAIFTSRNARTELHARLRELLTGEPVAWLHQVVCGDGESDQALSFAPDNFPLQDVLGYRSLSHEPLYRSPRPFDAASISDERIDAALGEWFDSCPIADAIARGVVTDYDIPSLRIDMRRAISAALVQP